MLNSLLRQIGAFLLMAMVGLSQAQAFTSTSYAPGSNMGTLTPTTTSFFGLATPPNPFSFQYTFDLATDSTVIGKFVPIAFVSITSFSLGTQNPVIATDGAFSQFLAAGAYTMSIGGTGVGFTGEISALAFSGPSLVPEADAMALALAGLCVAGVFLKRRNIS